MKKILNRKLRLRPHYYHDNELGIRDFETGEEIANYIGWAYEDDKNDEYSSEFPVLPRALNEVLSMPKFDDFIKLTGIQRYDIEEALKEQDIEKRQAFFDSVFKIVKPHYERVEREIKKKVNAAYLEENKTPPFPELLEENQISA